MSYPVCFSCFSSSLGYPCDLTYGFLHFAAAAAQERTPSSVTVDEHGQRVGLCSECLLQYDSFLLVNLFIYLF